jgi:hypothetical protein
MQELVANFDGGVVANRQVGMRLMKLPEVGSNLACFQKLKEDLLATQDNNH